MLTKGIDPPKKQNTLTHVKTLAPLLTAPIATVSITAIKPDRKTNTQAAIHTQ